MGKRKQVQQKQNQPSKPNVWSPTVVVAIISAISLIIVALINRSTSIFTTLKPIEATQTAEVLHTAIAMTAQLSPNTLIPSETSIPIYTTSPTTTSTWTPEVPTATSASTTIFEDTFIDNHNNWYIDSSASYVAAGKYTIDVSCPSDYGSFYCGTYIKIPFTFPRDFHMEMDVTILEFSSDASIAIGFQLRRRSSDHYYVNYFITDGFYSLKLTYNQRYLEIIPKTPTDLLSKELNSVNRLGIDVQNSSFTPIINGKTLPQSEDGNLIGAGDSYIEIFISRGNSTRLQFDNLEVQEVK